jgi:SlyX protein
MCGSVSARDPLRALGLCRWIEPRTREHLMNDDTVERIELKIAYLERANSELSDVLYRQQQEIAALDARLAALASQIELLKQPPPAPIDERPPHY